MNSHFYVFSAHAERIDLLLFDDIDSTKPSRLIPFNPQRNKTSNYWHVFVPGIRRGQLYAYRVHGPYDPCRGLRFDADKFPSIPLRRP